MTEPLPDSTAPSPRPRRKRGCRYFFNLSVAGLLGFLIFLQVAGAAAGYNEVGTVLQPKRTVYCCETPANAGYQYEDVAFSTADGLTLRGWYLPGENDAAVLLAHGVHGNRTHLWEVVRMLRSAGYAVLTFDLRSHGESDGEVYAQGWLDIIAAAEYLRAQGFTQIGAFGFSLGATMVIQGAAQTDLIRAVVADGAAPTVLADMPLPTTPGGWLYLSYDLVYWTQLEARSAPYGGFGAQPMRAAVAQIAPRPLLLIAAGAEASGFERNQVQALYDAAGEPKSVWIIEDVYHGGGFATRQDAYAERLIPFFNAALLAGG